MIGENLRACGFTGTDNVPLGTYLQALADQPVHKKEVSTFWQTDLNDRLGFDRKLFHTAKQGWCQLPLNGLVLSGFVMVTVLCPKEHIGTIVVSRFDNDDTFRRSNT